ncbi:MAG: hypothetical protein IT331_11505 [Anaerolineae bacterium]|nr:hypothetical protein [Anaerolineae bacterium]
MDNPDATLAASDRQIELFNNPGINDDSFEEVSSVYAWYDVRGPHTFRFSTRKSLPADGDMVVDSSSMAIICVKKNLTELAGSESLDSD